MPSSDINNISFPRGGQNVLTSLEKRDISTKAKEDVLFNQAKKHKSMDFDFDDDDDAKDSDKNKKTSLKRKNTNSKSSTNKKTKTSSDAFDSEINVASTLNWKNLSVGMSIMGVVKKISKLDITVSLPNQLTGYIPITELSETISKKLELIANEEKEVEENTNLDPDQMAQVSSNFAHSYGSGLLDENGDILKNDSLFDSDDEGKDDSDMSEDEDDINGNFSTGEIIRSSENVNVLDFEIPDLKKLFKIGQILPCNIKSLDLNSTIANRNGKSIQKRVILSIKPESFNSTNALYLTPEGICAGTIINAVVSSEEEKGYILYIGLNNHKGFLKKDDYDESINGELHVGTPITVCALKSFGKSRILPCTTKIDTINSLAIPNDLKTIDLKNLRAGSLCNIKVKKILENGISCTFLNEFFTATIDNSHLSKYLYENESKIKENAIKPLKERLEECFKIGKKLKARILWINYDDKRIAFTLNQDLIDFKPISFDETMINKVLNTFQVIRVDSALGLTVYEPNLLPKYGFVHLSKCSDEHVEKLECKKYGIDTKHKGRIYGYSYADSTYLITFQKSVIEQKFMDIKDIEAGVIIKGKILSLDTKGCQVELASNLKAFCPASLLSDITLSKPERLFKVGALMKFMVLQVEIENQRIILTHKKSFMESKLTPLTSYVQAKKSVGETFIGSVATCRSFGCIVSFYNGVRALVPIPEFPPLGNHEEEKAPETRYTSGQVVKVRIISANAKTLKIKGSFKMKQIEKDQITNVTDKENENKDDKEKELNTLFKSLKVGQIINSCMVKNILPGVGLNIKLFNKINGRCHLTEISDKFVKNPLNDFKIKQVIDECIILNIDSKNKRIDVSFRQSRMNKIKEQNEDQMIPISEEMEINPIIDTVKDVSPDMVLEGYIRSINIKGGIFVSLGRNIVGRVKISEISDSYLKEFSKEYYIGQLVKFRVMTIDREQGFIELSMKQSIVSPETVKPNKFNWDALKVGTRLTGSVKGIKEYGIFIQIPGTNISGLCHASQVFDNENETEKLPTLLELQEAFNVGDSVRAIIIKLNKDEKRISFGLKPSYFDINEAMDGVDESDNEESEDEQMDIEEDSDDENILVSARQSEDDEPIKKMSSEEDEESEDEESEDEDDSFMNAIEKSKGLNVGFDFEGDNSKVSSKKTSNKQKEISSNESSDEENSDSEEEEDSDLEESTNKNKLRKAKLRSKKEAELRTIEQEDRLASGKWEENPESSMDFDRLLLGNPNSSELWIKYMAFHLQLSEIKKAREVGKKALSTISYREEAEKLNIWYALMNLENTFGDEKSLNSTVNEAMQMNDQFSILKRLAEIYESNSKFEKVCEVYENMIKKIKNEPRVWMLYMEFLLKFENENKDSLNKQILIDVKKCQDLCSKLLQRSIQSLSSSSQQITVTSKLAQLQFKYGNFEMGRTIFESLLGNYPKRIDQWSIYLDMEIKQGDLILTRRLFERVLHLKKLSSKKLKFLFKKYLTFEKQFGTDESIEQVKELCREMLDL